MIGKQTIPNVRLSLASVLSGLLLGTILATGCQKAEDHEPDMAETHDLRRPLAPATATFSWTQGPSLDKYNFSNLSIQSNTPWITQFWLRGDNSDKRWYFSILGKDESLPTRNRNVFELTFGWAPSFSWQWFGQHPANYIEFAKYNLDNSSWDEYCFATTASSNGFSTTQGEDGDGRYLDIVAGPVTMGEVDNGFCDSSSPRIPSGTLTVTVRYRCNNIDNRIQGAPDWAIWVCQQGTAGP